MNEFGFAEVDDPVERVEHGLREVLGACVELIADERRDERLDPAGAERDQEQPGHERGAVVREHGEHAEADAVDQAEPQDRAVLPEQAIGDPSAEQREEVDADHERVEDVLRLALLQEQNGDEERRQDVSHPVEAEPLAALTTDDVGDLPRHLRGLGHAPS
jgi:hypothetical protein